MHGRRRQPGGGGSVFFEGEGGITIPEIVCSGAARWSKGSAVPPEPSGGTRIEFKGALSNNNYAFLIFGWGPGFCKILQKGSLQAENVAEGFLSEYFS